MEERYKQEGVGKTPRETAWEEIVVTGIGSKQGKTADHIDRALVWCDG